MVTFYILWLILAGAFFIASYFAIVEGSNLGMLVTGICLFLIYAFLLGLIVFV